MQARPTLAAVATALLIGAAAAVPARAQDAMFSFTDGEAPAQLVVPRPAPGATARDEVTIVNERNVVTRADIAIEPLTPTAAGGAVYAEAAIRLGRGGRHKLALEFNSGAAATPPGVYETELVVSGRNAARDTVLRKDVVVSVLMPENPPDVPLSVDRATPISDEFDETVIVTGLLPESAGAGRLTDEDGDTVEVRAETTPDAETGTSTVRLSGDGLASGTFSGRVALGDVGGIDVALRVEDSFTWLLLTLAIGVALAFAAERFVRGGRAEARRLVEQARRAVTVAERAGGQLTSQLQLFQQRAEKGELPAGGPPLAAQRKLLAAIERDLTRLRRALEGLGDEQKVLPPFKSKEVAALVDAEPVEPVTPRFLRAADVPAGDASPEELERQHRAIEQAAVVAEAWPKLHRRLSDLSRLLDGAREREMRVTETETVAAQFDVLLLGLRQADSAAEVDPDELAAALAHLQEQLALAVAGAPSTFSGDDLLPVPATPAEVAVAQPLASMELAPIAAQERRRRSVLSIISGLVVVFLGLLVLYFEDPFVSPEEYLAGVIWGLLGKILLDGVLTALDRFAAGRRGVEEVA